MNAKLFQIRLLKRILKCEKQGVLDRDLPRKPDSRTCERKADLCVCILKLRAEAMHKRMGQSARADCAVGAKYYLADPDRDWEGIAMHVNAQSSNHDPNHVLDRDPKCLSERDSFSCEHSQ